MIARPARTANGRASAPTTAPAALAVLILIMLAGPATSRAVTASAAPQDATRVPVVIHGAFHAPWKAPAPVAATTPSAVRVRPGLLTGAMVADIVDDFTVLREPAAPALAIHPSAIRGTPRPSDSGARTMPGALAGAPSLGLRSTGESEAAPGFLAGLAPHLADSLVPFPWEAPPALGGVDPQIAASRTHVIVTTSGQIAFYGRGGKLLEPVPGAGPFPNPVRSKDFFKPLMASMTASLNLPDGVDPTVFGLDAFYDTRVIFDAYRDRFWLVAEAVNLNSKKKGVANTSAQRGSRRTKMMVAVSISEDPRDGFHYYWWDAVQDDGACNDPDGCPGVAFRPGDAGDYPSLGITPELFIQTNSIGAYNPEAKTWEEFGDVKPRYTRVVFAPAGALAAGQQAAGWSFNDLHDPNGEIGRWIIQPAIQHGTSPSGPAYLTMWFWGPGADSQLVVWGFASAAGVPQSPQQVTVKIQGVHAPANAPQMATSQVPSPNRIRLDNMGNSALKAIVRDGKLHVVLQDCVTWPGSSECATSIRVVRVDLSSFAQGSIPTTAASGFIDRTFGQRNSKDAPGTVFSYGMPGIAVNADGDMLIAYNRSGSTIFPEARYSIFYGDEQDVRPGFLLHAGEAVVFNAGAKPEDSVGQIDTGGISVDPLDDRAFWIAQPYAYRPDPKDSRGGWRLAIARVVAPQNINIGG